MREKSTTPKPVLAADFYRSNGELILCAATLGYVGIDTLDLSYGRGVFWRDFEPSGLVTNDKDVDAQSAHHVDATVWPQLLARGWFEQFDTVVWDPPYRLNGTPDQSFDHQYGIGTPTTVAERMHVILAGARNAVLCTRPGGYTLVKCQNQVVSGKKVDQIRRVKEACEAEGAAWVDDLHFLQAPRPQPAGRKQLHARSNYSTLVVFRK